MELTPEVRSQLDLCSKAVGLAASDDFSQRIFGEFRTLNIESPIEQLYYVSFQSYLHLSYINLSNRMIIQPQYPLFSYKVDFYIVWRGTDMEKAVVVECDSQQWHERSENERRYEKRRDRRIASAGLHTFRFTGKEIMEDPFKPVIEVINFLTGSSGDDVISYMNDLLEGQ